MDRYIKQSTVLDTLRWRSADKTLMDAVKDIPEEDVVRVVRCEKCKKCEHDWVYKEHWCPEEMKEVSPDHYCGYGER